MIGDAWNIDDPNKPTADWDPQANIRIPIGLASWLESLGDSYGSHSVIAASPLECVDPGTYAGDAAGTVQVRMKLATGATFVPGVKYPFTIRVIGSDGVTRDDRTLWLRVKDR